MSGTLDFGVNRASAAQVAGHLQACDHAFVPPLSERVAIGAYARKIAEKAQRFEAWADGELVGLVAVYCTDPEKRGAFITSVSVAPEWQGRGIASQLVGRCLEHVRAIGFGRIELEVDSRNTGAVALYGKCGFETDRTFGSAAVMYLRVDRQG
jgi:ribosomal protein S18 acetylase RimI-like enzyme